MRATPALSSGPRLGSSVRPHQRGPSATKRLRCSGSHTPACVQSARLIHLRCSHADPRYAASRRPQERAGSAAASGAPLVNCLPRGGLAKLDQEGSHLATQLDRVTMPSVGVACLSLGPYPLEEPIHRRTMHGDPTLAPGLLDRGSLLNLLDHLAFGRLTLLWGNGRLHRSDSPSSSNP